MCISDNIYMSETNKQNATFVVLVYTIYKHCIIYKQTLACNVAIIFMSVYNKFIYIYTDYTIFHLHAYFEKILNIYYSALQIAIL
jgi:hypothetical protein